MPQPVLGVIGVGLFCSPLMAGGGGIISPGAVISVGVMSVGAMSPGGVVGGIVPPAFAGAAGAMPPICGGPSPLGAEGDVGAAFAAPAGFESAAFGLAAGAAFESAALTLGSFGNAATEGLLEPMVPLSGLEHAVNSASTGRSAKPRAERETERIRRSS